jgi:hypothetical protein
MITLHVISPCNEVRVVERLERDICACWPDLAASAEEHIDLLVGVRTQMDVDLLIVLDLAQPRSVGVDAGGRELRVCCGMIAVEIKQLDAQRFERVGNQLFPCYERRGSERREQRSVVDQARDAAIGVRSFATASGQLGLYVYALAWLTEVDEAELREIDAAVVGRRAGWREIVAAALRQSDVLSRADPAARVKVRAVRARLLVRRKLSSLDRANAERVSRDAVLAELVTEVAARAGHALIRLAGHGGSGKTTALTLLAARLATVYSGRVLILTFHQALSGDIRSIVETIPEAHASIGTNLRVLPMTRFLLSLLEVAGEVPLKAAGVADYDRLDDAYREAAALLDDGPDGATAASVIACDRDRFEWDYILIDEAQDWTDAERDLLVALYGHRRLVLADGLMQLVRRQVSCDWFRGVPAAERETRFLGDSLRMLRNVALFANAFADAIGLQSWSVKPHAGLAGGRIVIVEGELQARLSLVRSLGEDAHAGHAAPVDTLVCVPPAEVEVLPDGVRRSRVAAELQAAGMKVWDACEPTVRGLAPEETESWRVIQYDSCRGLQGWAVLLLAFDDLYANKVKHPNFHTGDASVDPEFAARRWLLIPLTRAVHLLVVHVRDPASPVAAMLKQASAAMPAGVVEWRSVSEAQR